MITQKDVEHIAHLARIELTGEEVQKFTSELAGILQFIEKLNEIDTKDVTPVRGGSMLTNEMRDDRGAQESIENKQSHLLDAVPEKKEGWVSVKAIFENRPTAQ